MPFVSTYQPALESNRKSPFTEHIFKRPLIISYTSIYNNQDYEVRATTIGVTNVLCEHSQACEHCDFFASTSRDKKFALRAASSLESTTRKQRAFLIFSACSNPYGNPFL